MLDCMLSMHETLDSVPGTTNKTKTRIWIHCISLSTYFLGIFFTLAHVLFFQSHVINSFYFSCVCMCIAYAIHILVYMLVWHWGLNPEPFHVCFDRCPSIVTYHYMHFLHRCQVPRANICWCICVYWHVVLREVTCQNIYIYSHVCILSRHISCKCVYMHATLSMVTYHHVWAFWCLWKFWSWSHWHICACWHTF